MKAWSTVFILLIIASIAALLVGPVSLEHPRISWVVLQLRLPRLVLALSAGASLAACGMIMQALLRNPLASPYTLGLGSASALGAALGILILPVLPPQHGVLWLAALPGLVLAHRFWTHSRAASSITLLASVFGSYVLWQQGLSEPTGLGALMAAVTIAVLLEALDRSGRVPGDGLLLAGVALGLSCGAGVMLLHYLVDQSTSASMLRWTMGSLAVVGSDKAELMVALLLASLPLFFVAIPGLNHIRLGSSVAASRGIDVTQFRRDLLLLTALWTGLIVALVGPLGFIGILAPHGARLLCGEDQRRAGPLALLLGAALLAGCDALARGFFGSMELPVGVVTALLGGPCFLVLLLQRRR
ncbi:MAG: iron ABC transporter permease [Myxococcales bacterium]|nr:iron ABC transporter permease [Myxococcales bacterium]